MNMSSSDEKEIFMAGLVLEPAEREVYLAEACGNDEALLSRVRELFVAHDGSRGPLDSPPIECDQQPTIDVSKDDDSVEFVGPFKLREKIGEGGMGAVYVADQKHPVKRRVALKIIKPGMDSRQVIARFRAERQTLAVLNHPNIAKVLDAGTTELERPYFVMELVNGLPITKYADEKRLTPRERLKLFIPVCYAVHHAHQKGIIHRDLKPSNILIAEYDGTPVPKVIDFGVAKVTNQSITEQSVYTKLGQLLGTLQYMSPEQAGRNQLDIDSRSDVYSLGVVLYELLTGATPLDSQRLRASALDEILRVIRDEEPLKPSTQLSSSENLPRLAADRHVDPKKLSVLVRGELDWVVMKALDKDRSRRYASINELAADIENYLNDEPVLACPPSPLYRFTKLLRRHKLAIGTVAVVFMSLCVGLIGTISQLYRALEAEHEAGIHLANVTLAHAQEAEQRKVAEKNFRKSLDALDQLLAEVGESDLASVPQFEPVRKRLLIRALQFAQSMLRESATDPDLLFETALAHRRVGDIQLLLGDHALAITSYGEAATLLDNLEGLEVDKSDRTSALAATLQGRGKAYTLLSERAKAIVDLQGARDHYLSLVQSSTVDAEHRIGLAEACNHLAEIQLSGGNLKVARTTIEPGIEALDPILTTTEGVKTCLRLLNTLGLICVRQSDSKAALEAFARARQLANKHATVDNEEIRYESNTVVVNGALTLLRYGQASQAAEAERILRQAVALGEELVADFPRVPQYRLAMHTWYLSLGRVLRRRNLAEAKKYSERGLDTITQLTIDLPDVPEYQIARGAALNDLATLHTDHAVVLPLLRDAISAQRQALKIDDKNKQALRYLANHLYNLANSLNSKNASPAEIEAAHRENVALGRRRLEVDPQSIDSKQHLGSSLHIWAHWLAKVNRKAESIEKAREAVPLMEQACRTEPDNVFYAKALARVRLLLADKLASTGSNEAPGAFEKWALAARRSSVLDSNVISWNLRLTSQKALESLPKVDSLPPSVDVVVTSLFRAALHQHVGRSAQAKEWFQKAESQIQPQGDVQLPTPIEQYRRRVRNYIGLKN